jgi:hypothetical protein
VVLFLSLVWSLFLALAAEQERPDGLRCRIGRVLKTASVAVLIGRKGYFAEQPERRR